MLKQVVRADEVKAHERERERERLPHERERERERLPHGRERERPTSQPNQQLLRRDAPRGPPPHGSGPPGPPGPPGPTHRQGEPACLLTSSLHEFVFHV